MDLNTTYFRFLLGLLLISSLTLCACAYETKEQAAIRLGKKSATSTDNTASTVPAGKLTSVQFYVPSMKENRIDVIDVVRSEVVGQIALHDTPTTVIFSSTKRDAYVALQDASAIAIVNTQTLQVEQEVEVGPLPHGLALSPDNRTLYVAPVVDQFIYTIDTKLAKQGTQKQAEPSIDLGNGATSNYLVLKNDVLYVSDHQNHKIYFVDVNANAVIRTIQTGNVPRAIELNETGTRLYVPCAEDDVLEVYDTSNGEKLYAVAVSGQPTDVEITEDEQVAWVTALEGNAVYAIDLTTQQVKWNIQNLPGAKHVAFNRLQSKLYVTLSDSNQIAIIDTQTGAIIGYIQVGEMPHGIQLKALPGIGGSCG